jgi:putative inorganic carbon (HCO3(-)) transporter
LDRIRALSSSLAQFEIWIVVSLVFVSLFWFSMLPVAIIIAAVFFLIRWTANGAPSIRTPGDWAILALALTLPVTLWVSLQPEVTRIQVYRLIIGIALYYAIANWKPSALRLSAILAGIALTALLLSFAAPFSVEWVTRKLNFISPIIYQRFSLVISDTIHPNVLAGNLVILFPVVLAPVFFGWRKLTWPERILYTLSSAITLATILLTQSRGAWMALGIGLLLLVVFRWRWGWVMVILILGIPVLVSLRTGLMPVLDFLMSSQNLRSLDDRLVIWARGVYALQDFPFTGIGMGSFSDVTATLYPFYLNDQTADHAHNLFMQVALDLGLPGLIAWLGVLLAIVATCWAIYRHGRAQQDGLITGIGAGLLCSQAALTVHGLTDAVTWGMVRPAPLVWGIWGVVVFAWLTKVGVHPSH